jgi:hypothetical protein
MSSMFGMAMCTPVPGIIYPKVRRAIRACKFLWKNKAALALAFWLPLTKPSANLTSPHIGLNMRPAKMHNAHFPGSMMLKAIDLFKKTVKRGKTRGLIREK